MKDTIFVQPDEEGRLAKFKIGEQEYTQDDILKWKSGSMMQDDYTRKTQELANQRKELEEQRKALEGGVFNQPQQTKGDESQFNLKLAQLELKYEMDRLERKYPDMNKILVLQEAKRLMDNGMPAHLINYEDIYNRTKPQKTEAELREEIRQQLLKEQAEGTNVGSIIGGHSNLGSDDGQLTEAELLMAKRLGMTPEEYKKYK